MSLTNCGCKGSCTLFALIGSAIIGIVAGVLRFTATITVTPAFLWVVFGIAVVYLFGQVIVAGFTRGAVCGEFCALLKILLLSILGTILLAVVLLGVTFVATSVLGTILTGILLFAFSMTLSTTACMVTCLIPCEN